MENKNIYCQYYQLTIPKKETWFVLGIIRNEDNIAIERSIDKIRGIIEFYVPIECEKHFLKIIRILKAKRHITDFTKKENRLKYESL